MAGPPRRRQGEYDDDEYSRVLPVAAAGRQDSRRVNGSGGDARTETTRDSGRDRKRDHKPRPTNSVSADHWAAHEPTSTLLAQINRHSAKLKNALTVRRTNPWDPSVIHLSQTLRDEYVDLLIRHWRDPAAGTVGMEGLWMVTSYWTITSYRGMIADIERRVGGAGSGLGSGSGGEGRRVGGRRGEESGPVELRKVLQRFQRFLTSEISFYQSLIRAFIQRFDLFGNHSGVGELKRYLGMLGEGLEIPNSSTLGEPEDQSILKTDLSPLHHLAREETQKKLALVHKALLSLGDIARYKEIYGPERERKRAERDEGGKGRRNGKAGPAGGRESEERFERARRYYAVAKGVIPDNGNPFNQLAVISVETGDTFDAIYHYHRALACAQPFKSAGQNLQRSLDRAKREWAAIVGEFKAREGRLPGLEVVAGEGLEGYKRELVLVQAINGDEELYDSDLLDTHYDHFHTLMTDRILPSAIIVKIVVLAIAADWNTMMAHVPAARHEWYFINCLNVAFTVCDAASAEAESCLDPQAVEALENSCPAPMGSADGGQVDINLSTNITAALRRMLPALRIISKWIKANVSRLARAHQLNAHQRQQVEIFARAYVVMLRYMGALFPLEQLPKLDGPLEEDHDMKGFSPLKRGMVEGEGDAKAPEVHPNEEQLMRISDILLDGKLVLFQAEAKQLFGSSPVAAEGPSGQLANLHLQAPAFVPEPESDPENDHEVASASTETEDDPVNMAMRATMGDGSSVDEDDSFDEELEEEEEQMVWGGRNAATPPAVMDTPRGNAPATAFDLVNNLVHPVARRPSQASSPTHRQSFSEQPRPPNRLFGGNVGSIWAPAMGEVNAVRDVPRSRSGSAAGFPRVQRDAAHSPSPWGTPDLHRTPQQDASNSFGSPTVAEFSTKRGDRQGSHGDGNVSFMPFG